LRVISQPLTREEVRSFRKEGFLRLPDFAPADEAEALRPIYDELFERKAGWAEGNFFDLVAPETDGEAYAAPQLLQMSRYAPELLATPIVQRARALARQILGATARLDLDHGIFKAAGSAAPTPWHQDEAFWDGRYDHDGLSVWIPLQPVDKDSGCLQFVPGSHRREVIRHQPIGGDGRVHGLEIPNFEPPSATICPLPLGGATVHHARTLHYSTPNTSPVHRRAYILTFTGRRRRRLISRPQHLEMTAESAHRRRELRATPPT